MKIAICAIAKDEGNYIAEWISHHICIGFSRIFIYNNDSADRTAEVCEKFDGLVKVVAWPNRPGVRAQQQAYKHFLENFSSEFDWIICLDCDEFINLKIDNNVQQFLMKRSASAIGINWRIFGSSGHEYFNPAPVTERFTQASGENFGANFLIKTIVRPHAVAELGVHSPKLLGGVPLVSPSGVDLLPSPAVRQKICEQDIICINHYFTKSRQEWETKKQRGRADLPIDFEGRFRTDADFSFHDQNIIQEESILRFRQARLQLLQDLGMFLG